MSYPIVVAIDPGRTTGVAACTLVPNPDDHLQRTWPQGFSSVEIPGGIDGFAAYFAEVLVPAVAENEGNVIWVVERFTISPRTTKTRVEYDALYIIGFMAGMHGSGTLNLRAPSQRRIARGKLKEWDNPTKDNHANDAAEHLVSWLVDTYPYLMEDLL